MRQDKLHHVLSRKRKRMAIHLTCRPRQWRMSVSRRRVLPRRLEVGFSSFFRSGQTHVSFPRVTRGSSRSPGSLASGANFGSPEMRSTFAFTASTSGRPVDSPPRSFTFPAEFFIHTPSHLPGSAPALNSSLRRHLPSNSSANTSRSHPLPRFFH